MFDQAPEAWRLLIDQESQLNSLENFISVIEPMISGSILVDNVCILTIS